MADTEDSQRHSLVPSDAKMFPSSCFNWSEVKSFLYRLLNFHYGVVRFSYSFWVAEFALLVLGLVANIFIQLIYNTILPLYGNGGDVKSAIVSAGSCLAFLLVTVPAIRVLLPAVYKIAQDVYTKDEEAKIELPGFVSGFAYVRLKSFPKVAAFLYNQNKIRMVIRILQKVVRTVIFIVFLTISAVDGHGTLNGTIHYFCLHGLRVGAGFVGLGVFLRIAVFLVAVKPSSRCCSSCIRRSRADVQFHLSWLKTLSSTSSQKRDQDECDYGENGSCWYHSKLPSLLYLGLSVVLLLFLFVSIYFSGSERFSKIASAVGLFVAACFQLFHVSTRTTPQLGSSGLSGSKSGSESGGVQAPDDNPELTRRLQQVLRYLSMTKTKCSHIGNVMSSALYTWFVLLCLGFAICQYAVTIRDNNTNCLSLKMPENVTSNQSKEIRPSLCESQWKNLDLIDLALLAKASYLEAETKDGCIKDINAGLRRLLPHQNWAVLNKSTHSDSIIFYELYNVRLNVTVIAVRGGQSAGGVMSNLLLWSETTILEFLSTALPLTSIVPKDSVSSLVDLATTLEGSLNAPARRHYSALDNYIDQRRGNFLSGDAVLLVGHSFGGGLAKISGASAGMRAVAFGAPGLGHSLGKFNVSKDQVRDSVVNVDLTGDPVAAIDLQGGSVAWLDCGDGNPWTCHKIDQLICELQEYCGRKALFDCSN